VRPSTAGNSAAPLSDRAYAVQNVPVTTPMTGLGWPVSRETEPADVSRETPISGLGWPSKPPRLPAPGAAE